MNIIKHTIFINKTQNYYFLLLNTELCLNPGRLWILETEIYTCRTVKTKGRQLKNSIKRKCS